MPSQNAGSSGRQWIVDPIDGTYSFVHGVPLYGVLIGVEVRGRPRVGVIYMPALDEMVSAAEGLGCTWNGRPARVSQTSRLEDACLTTTSPETARARSDAYETLADRVKLKRAWGDAYGNRVDRFLAGVAYLDGKRPSAVFARGYYTRASLVAEA